MRVLLVTSDRERCGIREYGRMLQAHLEPLGVEMEEFPYPDYHALASAIHDEGFQLARYDLVHVNHHAALHASWTDEAVGTFRGAHRVPVVVTQHDTFERLSIMRERGMQRFHSASAWVMHEEVAEINYGGDGRRSWVRQGVLGPQSPERVGTAMDGRPVLGVFGFDFPWKNFELAARLTAAAEWRLLVLSAGADRERFQELRGINPWIDVCGNYFSSTQVVERLAACDATAFLYTCGNSGTSGAIRLGLAARKPLVAFRSRQFRDLFTFPGIYWADDGDAGVRHFLEIARSPDVAKLMCASVGWIADTCSWDRVAQHYRGVYERALDKR